MKAFLDDREVAYVEFEAASGTRVAIPSESLSRQISKATDRRNGSARDDVLPAVNFDYVVGPQLRQTPARQR